jgi:alkylation response protein AidB-like acyl-CoA dehydrogenase
MRTLDRTRIGLAAANVGKARAAFDLAVDYAKKREVFGKPIHKYQAIGFGLAEIATEIEAAKLLTYQAAWLTDKKLPHTKETSMCKYYAVEVASKATEFLMKVLGGYGWSKDNPAGKLMIDSKCAQYGQGSIEIQKLIIAREIFGR